MVAAAGAAAGKAAVASARDETAFCLDAGAVFSDAAFLLATQVSLLRFCRSRLQTLVGHLLPCAHAWRIGAGEVNALITSARFKNKSDPAYRVAWFCARTRGSLTKSGKSQGCVCTHFVCLSLLNHQAGGDLHIQLPQHGLSDCLALPLCLLSSAFPALLGCSRS